MAQPWTAGLQAAQQRFGRPRIHWHWQRPQTVQKELHFSRGAVFWEEYALFPYALSGMLGLTWFRTAWHVIGLDVLEYLHRSCRLLLQRTNERNHVLHLIRRHGLVGRHLGRFAIRDDAAQIGITLLLDISGSKVRGLH